MVLKLIEIYTIPFHIEVKQEKIRKKCIFLLNYRFITNNHIQLLKLEEVANGLRSSSVGTGGLQSQRCLIQCG